MKTEAEGLYCYLTRAIGEVLGEERFLGVDWLDKKPDSYSMDTVPAGALLREYTGGASQRQYAFVLSSRKLYSIDHLMNLNNLGFFSALEEWLREHSRKGDLPALPRGRRALSVEILNPGYLLEGSQNKTGRYQMQCRMVYYQDAPDFMTGMTERKG